MPLPNYRPNVLEVNGDGKSDIFFCDADANGCVSPGGTFVRLSKGDGIFEHHNGNSVPSGHRLAAAGGFKGTGRDDVFWCKKDSWQRCNTDLTVLWDSTGGGAYAGYGVMDNFPANGLVPYSGDFTGNGRTDLFLCQTDQYGRCQGAAMSHVFSLGSPILPAFDTLSSFTTGLGVTTEITYRPLTDDGVYTKDTDGVYPVIDVQAPMYVVSRVDADDGVGGTYSSEYSYEGAKVDADGRGFLGFRRHVASDLETGVEQVTDFLQTYPYTGLAERQTKRLGAQVLNETETDFVAVSLGGTQYFVAPSQTVEESFDLDGTPIPAVTTTYAYDAYGNATELEVSTPDGAVKTTGNSFTNDITNWWL